jgi:hypothetical protein
VCLPEVRKESGKNKFPTNKTAKAHKQEKRKRIEVAKITCSRNVLSGKILIILRYIPLFELVSL